MALVIDQINSINYTVDYTPPGAVVIEGSVRIFNDIISIYKYAHKFGILSCASGPHSNNTGFTIRLALDKKDLRSVCVQRKKQDDKTFTIIG